MLRFTGCLKMKGATDSVMRFYYVSQNIYIFQNRRTLEAAQQGKVTDSFLTIFTTVSCQILEKHFLLLLEKEVLWSS